MCVRCDYVGVYGMLWNTEYCLFVNLSNLPNADLSTSRIAFLSFMGKWHATNIPRASTELPTWTINRSVSW